MKGKRRETDEGKRRKASRTQGIRARRRTDRQGSRALSCVKARHTLKRMGGRKNTGGAERRLFRAALYIRLSREDGDGGESLSVANQRALLISFAESDDTIESWELFTDDGYSGTDFNRPAFSRMLELLRKGVFNCVVVKDLSRFGRNYIGAGKYLEEEFPALGIRFIALSDGIDSYARPESTDSILLPFKNLLNDEYSRDISRKIRTALDTKRRKGEFIGSKASYGYRRSMENRGAIEPDPEAAAVVKRIFASYIKGISKSAIVRELNAEGVPSPSQYAGRAPGLWSYSSVDRILRNRAYVGDLVQGQNGNVSYKVQKTRRRPEDKWFIKENAHEALVSREDFAQAQRLMETAGRAEASGQVHPLAGLVRCAECGRALMRRRIIHSYKTYEYYLCPTYRQSKTACTKHAVRVDRVEREVLEAIRGEIAASVDFAELSKELSGYTDDGGRGRKALEKKLEEVMERKRGLYGDWKSGELTRQEYLSFKAGYDAQENTLRTELEKTGREKDGVFTFEKLRSLSMPEKLDRGLACALISRILINRDGEITVYFTFSRPGDEDLQGG